MKNLLITGIILLSISVLLFYRTTDGFTAEEIRLPHIMGILGGIGIGLIIGGLVGYVSKGNSLKEEQRKRDFKLLQKEREDLELRTQQVAQKEAEIREQQRKNPQI